MKNAYGYKIIESSSNKEDALFILQNAEKKLLTRFDMTRRNEVN